jgi:predicted amidohydrolase YtcJ
MENNKADLALCNGQVITVDKNDRIVEAVAIKDSQILEVGMNDDIKRFCCSNTQIIDLDGKVLIPGFIDAHTHAALVGLVASDAVVDCHMPPVESVDEILNKIRGRVKNTPKGQLVMAHGRFDQPYPTKEQLDQVAPENPVIIKNSMHFYRLNSLALKEFNITKKHPTQEELLNICPGGIIHRDPITREPTGCMEECLTYLFPKSYYPFSYDVIKKAVKVGVDRFSSAGVTSLTEFNDFPQCLRAYQELYENGDLNIKIQIVPCVHGLDKTTDLDSVIDLGLSTGFGNEWIRFMGIKIFVDLGKVTTLPSIKLNEMVLKAHKAGLRVYMHAISRKAQEMALEALEAAENEVPGKNMRHRIEHMGNEYLDPQFFDRIKAIGAIAVPTAYFMRIGKQDWLNPNRDRAYPFKTLLDIGLCVPGNSDSGGSEPEAYSPLYQIWCMVTRKSKEGIEVYPEEKISVMDAIKIYTTHSSYAGFEEDLKGSIEVGKKADFAVLRQNPLTVDEDFLKDIQVDMTIVNGKVAYQLRN